MYLDGMVMENSPFLKQAMNHSLSHPIGEIQNLEYWPEKDLKWVRWMQSFTWNAFWKTWLMHFRGWERCVVWIMGNWIYIKISYLLPCFIPCTYLIYFSPWYTLLSHPRLYEITAGTTEYIAWQSMLYLRVLFL